MSRNAQHLDPAVARRGDQTQEEEEGVIRKACEVAAEILDLELHASSAEPSGKAAVTADRLAIVERLRELLKQHWDERPRRLPNTITSALESEIRAAASEEK